MKNPQTKNDAIGWLAGLAINWAFRRFLRRAMLNKRTTIGGALAIVAGLAMAGNALMEGAESGKVDMDSLGIAVGQIALGVSALCARDSGTTSDDEFAATHNIPKAEKVD